VTIRIAGGKVSVTGLESGAGLSGSGELNRLWHAHPRANSGTALPRDLPGQPQLFEQRQRASRGLASGGDAGEPRAEPLFRMNAQVLQRAAIAGGDGHERQRLTGCCAEPGGDHSRLDQVGAAREFQEAPELVADGGAGERMQILAFRPPFPPTSPSGCR